MTFVKATRKYLFYKKNRRKSRSIVCFYIKAFVYFTHCIFYCKTCFTITFSVEYTKCTSFPSVYKIHILKRKLCSGKHISYRISKQNNNQVNHLFFHNIIWIVAKTFDFAFSLLSVYPSLLLPLTRNKKNHLPLIQTFKGETRRENREEFT